jgi:hydroxymethylglutaryl-CoA synthase
MTRFGISDMAFYLPAPSVDLDGLVQRRGEEGVEVDKLLRALDFTGQRHMRVPDGYEDTVTMVAEATRRLLARPGAPALDRVRHFYCGTETAQDAAKPVSAYVQGLVEIDGRQIGPHAATYEVKHACASGTYAVLGGLQALFVEEAAGRSGVAVAAMGDIASYPRGTTAELTQGAGAVSLLLEKDPRLLAIDMGITGIWGENVDDFFRAMNNRHASVRGRYSVECYMRAFVGAYEDYKRQALESGLLQRPPGGHFLDTIDYAILHAPFHSMPVQAMKELLIKLRGMDESMADSELERLRISAGHDLIRRTGNLYTGSLYLCLADLLVQEHRRLGEALEGKRVLLASYGSGNTMVVFGGTVMPGAGKVIEGLGVQEAVTASERPIELDHYEMLAAQDKFSAAEIAWFLRTHARDIPSGAYYLSTIRDDGYRVYRQRR